MVRKYDFDERQNISDKGNRTIINYLARQDETKEVKDVSYIEKCQKMDIDIIWYKKNGAERKIEVKIDEKMHRTGNFFLETISNDVKNTPGCFLYSEADDFYYYAITNDRLYIFDLMGARVWFRKHIEEFREVATSTTDVNGDAIYRTIGRLVPKEVLIENVEWS